MLPSIHLHIIYISPPLSGVIFRKFYQVSLKSIPSI